MSGNAYAQGHAPLTDADYAIALRVSALLADGGSLSGAIAYCCDLKHNDNAAFRARWIGCNPVRPTTR